MESLKDNSINFDNESLRCLSEQKDELFMIEIMKII